MSFSASVSRAETTCFFFAAIYLCFQLTCEKRFLVNDLGVGKVWCLFVDVNYSPKMRAQIYQAFWPITIIEPETKAKERDSWIYKWSFKRKKKLLFFSLIGWKMGVGFWSDEVMTLGRKNFLFWSVPANLKHSEKSFKAKFTLQVHLRDVSDAIASSMVRELRRKQKCRLSSGLISQMNKF